MLSHRKQIRKQAKENNQIVIMIPMFIENLHFLQVNIDFTCYILYLLIFVINIFEIIFNVI